jgi:outer membrane receptor protein involved in Fe transport
MKPIGTSILNLGRVVTLPLIGLALAEPVSAQEQTSLLEEIVVVAQKREENIMDVPVSITAISGAQIEASAIKDMYDLQLNVPGLIVGGSQTTTTSNFAIRGIGSTSNNFGVESSVGLYVDNVYRSRQSSLINELVDVQAVEVLRGPQGTLFGKNTAAGAIQVRTVAPSTDSADAFLELTGGAYGLQRLSGAANIPLTDNLAFRGTVFSSKRDGYVDNVIYDFSGPAPTQTVQEDLFNDRNRLGLRMQLGYDNGDNFDMRIIADYSKIDEVCCIGTSRVDSVISAAAVNPSLGDFGPDFARLLTGGVVLTDRDYPNPLPTTTLFTQLNAIFGPFGIPPFPEVDIPFPTLIEGYNWDDYRTAVNFAPQSENEDRGLSVEFNWDIGNTTLTSVTAYRAFDTYDFIDVDFTNSDIATRVNDATQTSISQELRLAGTFGDSSNWVVGAYYFAQEIKNDTTTTAGEDLEAFYDIDNMLQALPPFTFFTEGVTAVADAINGAGMGPFPPGASAFPAGTFANDVVTQDHSGYAVFGQVDWSMTDALTLTLGARYTEEEKDIDAIYTQTNPGLLRPDLPLVGATLLAFNAWAEGGMQGFPPDPTPLLAVALPNVGWAAYQVPAFAPRPDVTETLTDDQVTGTARISWFPSDEAMLYASYSTGFKSGGTNTDRLEYDPADPDNPLFSQLFDPETSTSIELGYKGDIGDRMRLSVALYQTEFEDFQSNTFEGQGFILRNAGDLEIKGLEVEWLWQVMDNTSITGYYAHNEGEYTSFVRGVCWKATPFQTLSPDPGANGDGSCDRTGAALPYNPEDRFMLAWDQNFPMGNNNMFFRAEYAYASATTTDGDTDPLTEQDAYGILNLRLGVDIDAWNSTVSVWGRNVLDERYYNGSFDPPLLDRGSMNSYPSEPATWGVTFRKNWD